MWYTQHSRLVTVGKTAGIGPCNTPKYTRLATLDDPDQQECEYLWVAEAARRYAEYKKGTIAARPADDVFRDARARIDSVV
uniref:Addiction module component n=1 Tax=Candidatus Kentrum sp. LFY TaxID=2126342 RepID=A0A450U6C9_9GAMM|nr:MAG: Putative addiction module component [Candidatus Kentron sp. LFY]